ncbi:MAG: sigma-54-dependent Fis family transcriptional regulator [Ignavibacteriaceae bacterium]|nr:sigma-54-dependent Fis family transcriptional regulator [Ignavibacteriaceae bacterium]
MNEKIMVVDDDENLLKSIKKILSLEHYIVDTFSNPLKIDTYLESKNYHCLLLDVRMPVMSGIDVLKKTLYKNPALPVVMISGQSDIETAVQAIKEGAYDFIEKPIDPERLFVAVKNAIQRHNLQEMSDSIYRELKEQFSIIGQSNALKSIVHQIKEVSNTPAKVLILGDSGTGKELVAHAIHFNSGRKGKPYVKLNCAAIPSELLESELFGHRKGAFTGAFSDRKGKFIEADGGTLFLDEIGNMSIQLQAKLLRVLEANEVEVIGENMPRKIDVRIISATNQNLEKLISKGLFREDLYYRLNVIKIVIPPLRDRVEDILPLAYHFLKEFSNSYNKQVLSIKSQVEALLINYEWPGNVRQLRNAIEKMVLFNHSGEIGYEEAINALELDQKQTEANQDSDESVQLRNAVNNFERKYILLNLQKHSWKISETANALGIDRSNLFKKMRKYGLNSYTHN